MWKKQFTNKPNFSDFIQTGWFPIYWKKAYSFRYQNVANYKRNRLLDKYENEFAKSAVLLANVNIKSPKIKKRNT